MRLQIICTTRSGGFNYDAKYKGASAKSMASLQEDRELAKDGYFLNHAKVLVGSGPDTYEKGKKALQTWRSVKVNILVLILRISSFNMLFNMHRHFGMDWAFVEPNTPVQTGTKICVCVKEILPWIMMPLQVAYVNETTKATKPVASFSYGSGTLQGHLLVSIFFARLNMED